MRITGGKFRGKKLQTPDGVDVRPASDKVRQAVFNMLQSDHLPANANVLDLFCGTGSYGLEALSRGAKICDFIDMDISLVRENVHNISLPDTTNIYKSRLPNLPKLGAEYDLVFVDPPYNQNLVAPTLENLKPYLSNEAIVVIESEAAISGHSDFEVLKTRQYGIAHITLLLYRKNAAINQDE